MEGANDADLEDLTIEEQVTFTARFKDITAVHFPNIIELLTKITNFNKVSEIQDLASIRGAICVCQTLNLTICHLLAL